MYREKNVMQLKQYRGAKQLVKIRSRVSTLVVEGKKKPCLHMLGHVTRLLCAQDTQQTHAWSIYKCCSKHAPTSYVQHLERLAWAAKFCQNQLRRNAQERRETGWPHLFNCSTRKFVLSSPSRNATAQGQTMRDRVPPCRCSLQLISLCWPLHSLALNYCCKRRTGVLTA